MTPDDALYHAVHDYAPGVPALAARMAISPSTLQNFANPNSDSHSWPLKRARQVIAFTGDKRPLHALCAEAGGVFVPLPSLPAGSDTIADTLAEVGKDFGELCSSLQAALADNRVTAKELKEFEERVYALNQASMALRTLMELKAKADPLVRAQLATVGGRAA